MNDVASSNQRREVASIIVADDLARVRSQLRRGLETEGYAVSEARNAREVSRLLDRKAIDLITLDLSIGGSNGLALAESIRKTSNVPIVMITDAIDDAGRIACLESGADDHMTKPFLIREVRARIKNVLRRYRAAYTNWQQQEASRASAYEFEGLVLDMKRRELRRCHGDTLGLTAAELNLLSLFVQRPSVVLSRDELALAFKGREWSPYDRTIDVLVARLRKSTQMPRLIKSVRGVGYVFTCKVTAR